MRGKRGRKGVRHGNGWSRSRSRAAICNNPRTRTALFTLSLLRFPARYRLVNMIRCPVIRIDRNFIIIIGIYVSVGRMVWFNIIQIGLIVGVVLQSCVVGNICRRISVLRMIIRGQTSSLFLPSFLLLAVHGWSHRVRSLVLFERMRLTVGGTR